MFESNSVYEKKNMNVFLLTAFLGVRIGQKSDSMSTYSQSQEKSRVSDL